MEPTELLRASFNKSTHSMYPCNLLDECLLYYQRLISCDNLPTLVLQYPCILPWSYNLLYFLLLDVLLAPSHTAPLLAGCRRHQGWVVIIWVAHLHCLWCGLYWADGLWVYCLVHGYRVLLLNHLFKGEKWYKEITRDKTGCQSATLDYHGR